MPTESRPVIANEADLASCLEQYKPRLQAFFMTRLDPQVWARVTSDDLMQEMFVRTRTRLDAYRRSNLPLTVWLLGQANDVVIEVINWEKAGPRDVRKEQSPEAPSAGSAMQPADPHSTPSQHVAKEELRQILRDKVLPQLSPEDQEIVKLHFIDGLTYKQIAQRLGFNKPNTVAQRCARAMLILGPLVQKLIR